MEPFQAQTQPQSGLLHILSSGSKCMDPLRSAILALANARGCLQYAIITINGKGDEAAGLFVGSQGVPSTC
jgi:hypothetical protein